MNWKKTRTANQRDPGSALARNCERAVKSMISRTSAIAASAIL